MAAWGRVMADPWRALIEAIAECPDEVRRRRMASELFAQRDVDVAERLATWAVTMIRLAARTDVEIADLVRDALFDREPIGSPVSELLHQAIARLRRARGGALVETEPDEEVPRG